MDEAANKGLKLLEVKGSDAAIPKSRDIGRVVVWGYHSGLDRDDVESKLRKHFSSCGEITDVYIPTHWADNSIWGYGYMYFVGEGAVDKALQLSGSDMGGWNVSVEAISIEKPGGATLMVKGYDTSLSEIDIQSALSKHFSSCGEIKVKIIGRAAVVLILGEDAPEKAMELSVFHMGGRKVVARLLSAPGKPTVHWRPRGGHGGRGGRAGRDLGINLAKVGRKAKMTAEQKALS